MQVIDPKTYDVNSLNVNKIESTIKSFYQNDKTLFLKNYSELSDIERFYTLSATILTFQNLDEAKRMYLDQLKTDLMVLRVLNKPENQYTNSYTEIVKQLPKDYKSYWSSTEVSETINKFEAIGVEIENEIEKQKKRN